MKPALTFYSRQLALQCIAAFFAVSLVEPYFLGHISPLPWALTTAAIGFTAFLLSTITHQPWWWRLIHTAFAPLTYVTLSLAINPTWYLAGLVGTALIFRGALTERTPLYFSNRPTSQALVTLTASIEKMRLVDLGGGVGSVVSAVAKERPDAQIYGIESAALTWLIGRFRTHHFTNCTWLWGDLWLTDLSEFNVVYAFLSPSPMTRLWEKAKREMRPGSILISNSFQVPGIAASRTVLVADKRHTHLYCYRI